MALSMDVINSSNFKFEITQKEDEGWDLFLRKFLNLNSELEFLKIDKQKENKEDGLFSKSVRSL